MNRDLKDTDITLVEAEELAVVEAVWRHRVVLLCTN